ncbi:hypothetical protein BB561_003225 [Smittium simulii]|uniref:Myb-like domain-containing protein n=1 Tax=Smittium simulii TaxID=133385 RepID=A0A2T9YMH3_9FUNG|nr:hypothetical protein BB561_003225 [Smittium simulii]
MYLLIKNISNNLQLLFFNSYLVSPRYYLNIIHCLRSKKVSNQKKTSNKRNLVLYNVSLAYPYAHMFAKTNTMNFKQYSTKLFVRHITISNLYKNSGCINFNKKTFNLAQVYLAQKISTQSNFFTTLDHNNHDFTCKNEALKTNNILEKLEPIKETNNLSSNPEKPKSTRSPWSISDTQLLLKLAFEQLSSKGRIDYNILSLKMNVNIDRINKKVHKINLIKCFIEGRYPTLKDIVGEKKLALINSIKTMPKEYYSLDHAKQYLEQLGYNRPIEEENNNGSKLFLYRHWSPAEINYLIEYSHHCCKNAIDCDMLMILLGRTKNAILNKIYSLNVVKTINYGRWSLVESDDLKTAVSIYGPYNWIFISKYIKTRDPYQCRQHYSNFKDFYEDNQNTAAISKYSSDSNFITEPQTSIKTTDLTQVKNKPLLLNKNNKALNDTFQIDTNFPTNDGLLNNDQYINSLDLSDLDSLINNSSIGFDNNLSAQPKNINTIKYQAIQSLNNDGHDSLDNRQNNLTSDKNDFKSTNTRLKPYNLNKDQIMLALKNGYNVETPRLLQLVEKYPRKWKNISKEFSQLNIKLNNIYNRYSTVVTYHLIKMIDYNIEWSDDDDKLLLSKHKEYINDWVAISTSFAEIPAIQCKFRWHLLNFLNCYTFVYDNQQASNKEYTIVLNEKEKFKFKARIQKLELNIVRYYNKTSKQNYSDSPAHKYLYSFKRKLFHETEINEITNIEVKQGNSTPIWTEQQSQELLKIVDEFKSDPNIAFSWPKVSSVIKEFSGFECREKYYKLVRYGSHIPPWTHDEDKIIFNWVLAFRKTTGNLPKRTVPNNEIFSTAIDFDDKNILAKIRIGTGTKFKYYLSLFWIKSELSRNRSLRSVYSRFSKIDSVLEILDKYGVCPKLSVNKKGEFQLDKLNEEYFQFAWDCWLNFRNLKNISFEKVLIRNLNLDDD